MPDYPTPEPPGAFFSAIPRHVWSLVARGDLKRADAALLGVLLDYKPRDGTVVLPTQATLARRLACSVDTVQRGLKRLADAGLIVKQRLRDAAGRLRGLAYDLAATLARMPARAAKLRSGVWGTEAAPARPAASETRPAGPPPPTPQPCGAEEDGKTVAQADTASAAAVGALVGVGVLARVAHALVQKFGAAACRRQVQALARRRNVRDRAALVVAAIQGDWAVPRAAVVPAVAPAVPPARPRPRPAVAPPPDPLAALPPERFRRLEARARADLRDRLPVLRPLLDQGRCVPAVRARMRVLLGAASAAPVPEPLPGSG